MKQKSGNNAGYRLGLLVRRLLAWNARLADNAQQRGIPRWIARLPALLVLAVIAGLLITGAVFAAGFLLLVLFLAICLSGGLSGEPVQDDYLEGYQAMGPEGPGTYEAGRKISDQNIEFERWD